MCAGVLRSVWRSVEGCCQGLPRTARSLLECQVAGAGVSRSVDKMAGGCEIDTETPVQSAHHCPGPGFGRAITLF